MAQYILKSDAFTAITETEGTLVNISNVPAEINLSGEFGTGIAPTFAFCKESVRGKSTWFLRQIGSCGNRNGRLTS